MKDNRLINHLRNTLSEHECDVPESVWKNIETQLPPSVRLHSPHRRYATAVAAILAVIILTALFTRQEKEPRPSHPLQAITAVSKQNTLLPHPRTIRPVEKKHLATLPAQPSAVKTNAESLQIPPEAAKNGSEPAAEESPAAQVPADPAKLEIDKKDPVLDRQPMTEITRKIVKNKIPRNWLSVKANAMSAGTATPLQYITRAAAAPMTYRHNMPLAVSASFEKRFGRWGVGSGLTYTYMSADYEMADNQRKGTQTLHYLGIPLYASFQVAQIKRFSFYASAGGEVDFNISGTQRESPDSQAYATLKKESVRDKKPQFSVQAHIGAAFELFKRLDLYVEPTLGYYIPNHSSTHSIWHDRLWNASLSLGLRKGF